jgi:hypothetical protein
MILDIEKMVLAGALSMGATQAFAELSEPLRGPEIGRSAGNCFVGPFPIASKPGHYASLCEVMSDAEKCLAYVKYHFNSDGSSNLTAHPEKLKYCIEAISKELLGE